MTTAPMHGTQITRRHQLADQDGRTTCMLCGGQTVEPFLELGSMALANKFVTRAELSRPERRYPLTVGFCHICEHVQLTDAVAPDAMFADYLYTSSASDTLKAHLDDLARTVTQRLKLTHTDLVVDIGCNDGTLIDRFRDYGVRALGVDPARNLADLSRDKGLDRMVAYFTPQTAWRLVDERGPAAAITITNTFPHIQDLHGFMQAVKIALRHGGTLVIEAHYLMDMLEQGAFDTVYHEHVSYWALGPMMRLFALHGLEVVNAERLPLHHGQLRATVMRHGERRPEPAVAELLEQERAAGLDKFSTYVAFASRVYAIRAELLSTLRRLRAEGKRVVAYGAPAKGNTLIEFLGLDSKTIEYIVDRSPLKQGRYSPGAHIPVVAPERLLEDQPDYVVLLAWNFRDEILEQQAEYRSRGGKFITPLPRLKVH